VATLLNGPGVDAILSRTEATGTTSFLPDGLGSTIALTDSAGTLQTQYTYEPFGKTTATGAASTNAFTYTDREDDGTGLYYYRTRYYHPALQRFVSEDPIGFDGGDTNLYAYVGNDPVNFIDPHGLINDNPNNWGFEGGGGSIPPASAPTGRSGNPLVPPNPNAPARNAPGSINGRPYVGHAFDQMQNRGIPPSVVEDAISTGQQYPGRYGRTQYYDPKNDITVITEPDGTVVTVRPGGPSGLYK
jgi:RHS repeat-associated protein